MANRGSNYLKDQILNFLYKQTMNSTKRTETWRIVGKRFPDVLVGIILSYIPEYKYEDLKYHTEKHGASFDDQTVEIQGDLFKNKWSVRTDSSLVSTKIGCPISPDAIRRSLDPREEDGDFNCVECKKKA